MPTITAEIFGANALIEYCEEHDEENRSSVEVRGVSFLSKSRVFKECPSLKRFLSFERSEIYRSLYRSLSEAKGEKEQAEIEYNTYHGRR